MGTRALGEAVTKRIIKPPLSLVLHLHFGVSTYINRKTPINQKTIGTGHINKRKCIDLLDKAREGILEEYTIKVLSE